jgi:hypothetical protein
MNVNSMQIMTQLACDWVQRCFGSDVLSNKQERAMRLLEEAIELAQSVGVPLEKVRALEVLVYDRPVGNETREMGSVLLTAVVMCRTLGYTNPADLLLSELRRVLDTDVAKFRRRWQEKIDAGVAVAREPEVEF